MGRKKGVIGKIVTGVLVAGSSVLSLIAPPIGVPLLGATAALATKTWGSADKVAQSGVVVASGNVEGVLNQVNAGLNMTMTALQRQQEYRKLIAQGHSPQVAASASGLSALSTTPNYLLYGALAIAAFFVLKILKIIR